MSGFTREKQLRRDNGIGGAIWVERFGWLTGATVAVWRVSFHWGWACSPGRVPLAWRMTRLMLVLSMPLIA
jgi:hypothetical protein